VRMIEEIRNSLRIDIRASSQGFEYLDAVIQRSDLQLLNSLLMKHLGPAAREPGTEGALPTGIQRLLDSMGGLRSDQSFYCKQGKDGSVVFALLWPWASNPEKITLKAGNGSI
jgi:hypothetical protein